MNVNDSPNSFPAIGVLAVLVEGLVFVTGCRANGGRPSSAGGETRCAGLGPWGSPHGSGSLGTQGPAPLASARPWPGLEMRVN